MLPVFDDFSRLPHTKDQIQFICPLHTTSAANHFFAYAMLMEPSSITIEKADYSNESLLLNMTYQMISLLTTILFFSTFSKHPFELEVRIKMNTNGFVYFNPTGSMVCMREVFYSHKLDTPFTITKILTDVQTSTLADLLQEQMHAFTSRTTGRGLIPDPYVKIQRDVAIYYINNIKEELGIEEGLVN